MENITRDTKESLPQHIAIIMDGNNRWAKARSLSAKSGHRAGAEIAKDLVNSCVRRGIGYLTLFAFSSENWLRPHKEVQGLMALFLAVLKRNEINLLHKNNVKLQFIGNRGDFSKKLQMNMQEVEELTAANTGLKVVVAADYGGRWDIANAARVIAGKVAAGKMSSSEIDVETVQQHICLNDYPDPDLCIRTGGERRLSNFLLWQFAYSELYFTECYWPDFNELEFQLALDDFAQRQRSFGGHKEPRAMENKSA
ncbi:MAG: polyprenyl diphosphate synthase [Gammaproteobacteria bacterium]|jgi:undecaprenyl diphosphate synthase|nr:di-trans,poly-cis-decaprenylcistransferase [Gammaproteobacteria bacterium]MDP6095539.1 polyprenyl diphosphate synthase [Gammaproteobacteria bacterium]MDP7456242.1 polyprenyl diphosphate synthase [Gammaproteobacteria bacterium]|tara:strand:- start:99 stop:860 length:762 start_codon:yes stop_codon:yes gene_type:complete